MVSVDILKADAILRRDPSDITATLKTIPGVDINDKQLSIWRRSGWTYGGGARSLIMADGMSVLTPGFGEINWNMIPMKNIVQVEILKGASSVLYGSLALIWSHSYPDGTSRFSPSDPCKYIFGNL